MSRTFAYCRVSTADQQTKNQIQEIKAAGFDVQPSRVVCENISGSTAAEARPGFIKLLERLESGDVLIVTKLDRLGRNSIDVQQTVQALEAGGVRVHCLALGGVDLTSSAGKMTMGVLAAVAQFERDLIIERTQAGLQRAKSEGKVLGRPSVLSGEQQQEVLTLLGQGATVYAVAKTYNTSRQVIMRVRDNAAVPA
ncbi:recombinase family protein [Caballeronia sp. KNU42]